MLINLCEEIIEYAHKVGVTAETGTIHMWECFRNAVLHYRSLKYIFGNPEMKVVQYFESEAIVQWMKMIVKN